MVALNLRSDGGKTVEARHTFGQELTMENGKLSMLAALVGWGLWGFASRQAVEKAHPLTVQWLSAVPQVLMLPLWYLLARKSLPDAAPSFSAIFWSFATCVLTVLASLMFSYALKTEKSSTVITVTSAYPVVVLALLVLTGKESFSWTQLGGCLLIVAGVAAIQT